MATKRILAFGASNSSSSINKQFATFAAGKLAGVEITLLDLNDFPLPIYSKDLELAEGIPRPAKDFAQLIQESDGVIISVAEHNGLFTSVFKNLWDWMSRLNSMNIWYNKPLFLLSASPSRRRENNVMRLSKQLFPHMGGHIIASFYLPSFNHTFHKGEIVDETLRGSFQAELAKFQLHLNTN